MSPVLFCAGLMGLLIGSGSDAKEHVHQRDRDICAHFRDEPWPEGSSSEAAKRRKFIATQVNRYCKPEKPIPPIRKHKSRSAR